MGFLNRLLGGVKTDPEKRNQNKKISGVGADDYIAKAQYYEKNRDRDSAIEWYEKAAECNHPVGLYKMGVLHMHSQEHDIAMKYFQKAADLGHGGAYYFLATYYMDGNVVQKNEQRAFEYYRRAAELGDEAGQAYLGMCYLDGTGTDKNEKAAFFWLSKCPDIDWSGLGLVKCYINGLGTSQNVNKGLKILMDIAKPHSSNVFVTEARTLARECANKGLPISAKFIAEIDAADKKESDLIDELIATFNEEDFN